MIEINKRKLCESCFCETEEKICPHCGFSAEEYSADPLVLPMGTRLGDKIVIGRVMGKGGFGVTYLGYDTRMDKTIAVKEYYPNGIAYRLPSGTEVAVADTKSSETFDSGAEKFYAEAEMVAQFNGNPNIVSVYDYFRENNTVYLIMEYISGITLKNYVKRHGRLTDGQALFVMDKIAAALSITHSAGVLHRDISPDNIMICKDGKVKLIDFGAARQIMAESSSNLTVVMKPGYTPIEQYTKKGKQGAWTDIYSLGVSVYYALTEVIIDDPYARMDDDSELDENRHGVNNDLWTILKKCTMINASDRYGSAIDLRKALKSVSAPIKSEPINLTDDDLKTDINSNAPIAPDEITDKKEIPLTTAAPVSETTEVIEVFEEDSSPPPPADENIHAAEAVVTDSTDKEKAKLKKPVLIGICAAAVLIVGIIVTAIAVNKPDNSEIITSDGTVSETKKETDATTKETAKTTAPSYVPDKANGAMVLDSNDLYWASTNSIPKSALEEFYGDIRVTLKLAAGIDNERTLRILDGSNNDLDVNAFAAVKNEYNEFEVNNVDIDFVFVIPHDKIKAIEDKISFIARYVSVKSAVLEDSTYDKVIDFDGKYPGDFEGISDGISIDELTCYDGDVRITLDLDINILGEKNEIFRDDDSRDMPVSFIQFLSDRYDSTKVNVSADNQLPPANHGMYSLVGTGEAQFSFTVSQQDIKNYCQKDLNIQVYNCVVKKAYIGGANGSKRNDSTSAKLSDDEKTVTAVTEPEKIEKPLYKSLDSKYQGDWQYREIVSENDLKYFKGDIKVKLDIELADENEYTQLKITDQYGDAIDIQAYNMGRNSSDCYILYKGQTEFAFVVKGNELSKASKIQTTGTNVIVKGVTADDYDSKDDAVSSDAKIIQLESKFPGSWEHSDEAVIRKKDLLAFNGDVRVTLEIEAVKTGDTDEDNLVHIAAFGRFDNDSVTLKTDYITPCEYGDHLYALSCTAVPDKFTFVITAEEIAELDDNYGLFFMGSNFTPKSAALEKA